MNPCSVSQSGYSVVTICFPQDSLFDEALGKRVCGWMVDDSIVINASGLNCMFLVQRFINSKKTIFEEFKNLLANGKHATAPSENLATHSCFVSDNQSWDPLPLEETEERNLLKLLDDLPSCSKTTVLFTNTTDCIEQIKAIFKEQKIAVSKRCESYFICVQRTGQHCPKVKPFGQSRSVGNFSEHNEKHSTEDEGKIITIQEGKNNSIQISHLQVIDGTEHSAGAVLRLKTQQLQSRKGFCYEFKIKDKKNNNTSLPVIQDEQLEEAVDIVSLKGVTNKGKHVLYGEIYPDPEDVDVSDEDSDRCDLTDAGIPCMLNGSHSDCDNDLEVDGEVAKDAPDLEAEDLKNNDVVFRMGNCSKSTDIEEGDYPGTACTHPSVPDHKSEPMHAIVGLDQKIRSHLLRKKRRLKFVPQRKFLVYSGRRRGARKRNQIREAVRMRQSDEYSRNLPFQDPFPPERHTSENTVTSSVSIFNRFKDRNSIPSTSASPSLPYEEMQVSRVLGVNSGLRHFGRPSRAPKYPQYREEQSRRDTFFNWPETAAVGVDDMVVAGFFFSGRDDLVRCYHCGVGLREWSAEDIPMLEHVRNSHNCSFLANTLQPVILAEYMAELNIGFGTENASRQPQDPVPPPQSHPRSPEYSTRAARLASFDHLNWPTTIEQTPQDISDAGFYYTGTDDLCRCFHCDGGFQHWRPGHDPWREHAKSFPNCRFVVDAKGQAFVRAAQQDHRATEANTELVASSAGGPLTTEAGRVAVEAGFSEDAILRAGGELSAQGNDNYTTAELLNQLLAQRGASPW